MRGLVVLGSTGSIGRQTLDVVRAFPGEFKVVGLAAGLNLDLLASQIEEFKPRTACCALEDQRNLLPDGVEFVPMEDMVCQPGVELVMAATIGSAGLVPTIRALENGVDVALANKEVIIMAGDMIMSLASAHGAAVLPVDSEPSAIWQCLQGDGDSRAGAEASNLEDGQEDHRGFGHPHEQGLRGDRDALSFQRALG